MKRRPNSFSRRQASQAQECFPVRKKSGIEGCSSSCARAAAPPPAFRMEDPDGRTLRGPPLSPAPAARGTSGCRTDRPATPACSRRSRSTPRLPAGCGPQWASRPRCHSGRYSNASERQKQRAASYIRWSGHTVSMPLLFLRAKLFHRHRQQKSVRGDVPCLGESPVLPVFQPGVLSRTAGPHPATPLLPSVPAT